MAYIFGHALQLHLGVIKVIYAPWRDFFIICLNCILTCWGHFEFIAFLLDPFAPSFASNAVDSPEDYMWISMRKWKSALLFLLSWAERVAANLKAVVWYFWFIYLFCVQKWEKPVTLCMGRIFAQRRFSLGWIILYAFHLLIVLLCLYCDFVYTRSNVLTGCVNDGVSIGASLQIVSIIKTHADSVWGSCFSSFAPSSLHLWYLRKSLLFIQFWNHFHVRTLMTVTFFLKVFKHVSIHSFKGKPCDCELCLYKKTV